MTWTRLSGPLGAPSASGAEARGALSGRGLPRRTLAEDGRALADAGRGGAAASGDGLRREGRADAGRPDPGREIGRVEEGSPGLSTGRADEGRLGSAEPGRRGAEADCGRSVG